VVIKTVLYPRISGQVETEKNVSVSGLCQKMHASCVRVLSSIP